MPTSQDPERFLTALRPRLVGALTLWCGDRGVAEELAQDVIVRLWDRWARVATADNVEAYAFRAALNAARTRHRRLLAERRARARLLPPVETHDEDLAGRLSVRRAVAALPPRQRTALVLRYYADLPVSEVAAAMGCAEGTVKAHTAKALASLRGTVLAEDSPPASVTGTEGRRRA